MDGLTLAIPFWNTSSYFKEATELGIKHDLIKEIVVSDDASSEDEWKKLNDIVNDLDSDKIKLFRNKNNLGGFRNKYNAVKNSTCEWVYLLDSDNHPYDTTLDIIQSIENPDSNICYSPQTLLLHQEDTPTPYDSKTYNFRYNLIGIDDAQDAIFKKTEIFNQSDFLKYKMNTLNDVKKIRNDF